MKFSLPLILIFLSFSAHADLFSNDAIMRFINPFHSHYEIVQLKSGPYSSANGAGVLIGENRVLTAFHVTQNSTHGETFDGKSEFIVTDFLEVSPVHALDYAIIKIEWTKKSVGSKIRQLNNTAYFTYLHYGRDHSASKIYTVGYPNDRLGMPTISNGFAKELLYQPPYNTFKINAGVTLGNSGGPVYDALTGNFLGLVIGGPNHPENEEFYNNDPEDSNHWNDVLPLGELLKASSILRNYFQLTYSEVMDLKLPGL